MSRVARVTISVETALLAQFQAYLAANGFPSRSEAVKSLIRKALVDQEWQRGREVAGAVTLVYDHHRGGVLKRLVGVQHDFGRLIVCTQHVHLDHHNCMELVAVRGRPAQIRELLARLKSAKGVKHSALMMATTGKGVG